MINNEPSATRRRAFFDWMWGAIVCAQLEIKTVSCDWLGEQGLQLAGAQVV